MPDLDHMRVGNPHPEPLPQQVSEEERKKRAYRAKLFRNRRARGVRPITVEASDQILSALAEKKFIHPKDLEGPEELAYALGELLQKLSGVEP